MSTQPTQIRTFDPYASVDSNVFNRVTRLISNNSDCLLHSNPIVVTKTNATNIALSTGHCIKDDVLIEISSSFAVDMTASEFYTEFGGTSWSETGYYYVAMKYVYSVSTTAPVATVHLVLPSLRTGWNSSGDYLLLGILNVTDPGTREVTSILKTDGTETVNYSDIGNDLFVDPSTGNVGIGTLSPNYNLDIVGDVNIQDGKYIRLERAADEYNYQIWNDTGNNLRFGSFLPDNNAIVNDILTLKDTGRVGIGTTSPAQLLDIVDYDTAGSSTSIFPLNIRGDIDNVGGYIGLLFGMNNTFGTTYQKAAIIVEGTSGSVQPNMHFALENTADSSNVDINDVKMTILNNGFVGIGTSAPGYKIDVVGAAGLSTGTAWTNTSDKRLKITQDLQDGLDIVLKLKPIKYEWNKKHEELYGIDKGYKYGFIAQDVQQVIPEMVGEDKKGYLTYNPSGIESILTKAIQEQQKQIEELLLRIKILEQNKTED